MIDFINQRCPIGDDSINFSNSYHSKFFYFLFKTRCLWLAENWNAFQISVEQNENVEIGCSTTEKPCFRSGGARRSPNFVNMNIILKFNQSANISTRIVAKMMKPSLHCRAKRLFRLIPSYKWNTPIGLYTMTKYYEVWTFIWYQIFEFYIFFTHKKEANRIWFVCEFNAMEKRWECMDTMENFKKRSK